MLSLSLCFFFCTTGVTSQLLFTVKRGEGREAGSRAQAKAEA